MEPSAKIRSLAHFKAGGFVKTPEIKQTNQHGGEEGGATVETLGPGIRQERHLQFSREAAGRSQQQFNNTTERNECNRTEKAVLTVPNALEDKDMKNKLKPL